MYINHTSLGATSDQTPIIAAPAPKTLLQFLEDVAWGVAVGVGIELTLKVFYSTGILTKHRSSRTSSVL